MNPEPGGLEVTIEDDRVLVAMTGGAGWELPLGPATLLERELERADPPTAIHLTNALAAVHDHFDDVVNAAPSVLAAPSLVIAGEHATGLARVEAGADEVPPGFRLWRRDAEEVFRTLVAEPAEERQFNPGLPLDQVETIVGTCCVVLAVMRRLELDQVGVDAARQATAER